MSHDFDPISMFCKGCAMPMRMLANDPELADCAPATTRIWQAREVRDQAARVALSAELAASRAKDAEPLPDGTTWGDLRRALGIERWPA